jgi:hypothetical protein
VLGQPRNGTRVNVAKVPAQAITPASPVQAGSKVDLLDMMDSSSSDSDSNDDDLSPSPTNPKTPLRTPYLNAHGRPVSAIGRAPPGVEFIDGPRDATAMTRDVVEISDSEDDLVVKREPTQTPSPPPGAVKTAKRVYASGVYEKQNKRMKGDIKILKAMLQKQGIDDDDFENVKTRLDLGDGMKNALRHVVKDKKRHRKRKESR